MGKIAVKHRKQLLHLPRRKGRRCPSADIDRVDHMGRMFSYRHLHFPLQCVQIFVHRLTLQRIRIEIAVKTFAMAKGNMDVNRFSRQFSAPP